MGRTEKHLELLHFHCAERVAYYTDASGRKHRVASNSAQQFGILALLVDARLRPADDGWRYDSDISAEAPGQEDERAPKSLNKRMQELCQAKSFMMVIETGVQSTVGPWRLRLDPPQIKVADPELLKQLLKTSRSLRLARLNRQRGRSVRPTKRGLGSHHRDDVLHLAEQEEWIERGIMTSYNKCAVERLMASTDHVLRGRAQRVDAMRLRRLGKLEQAGRRMESALHLFRRLGDPPPLELAAACEEAGAIAYHQNEQGRALEFFERAAQLLNDVTDVAARSRHLARVKRWRAFVELRLGNMEASRLAAEEAAQHAEHANDLIERAYANLAHLRVLVHSGAASEAIHQLAHAALVAPASHPTVNLMARRFYAEALFKIGRHESADQVVLSVLESAKSLELAREADAAVNLLRWQARKDALRRVKAGDRSRKRDRLDDRTLTVAMPTSCASGRDVVNPSG